MNKLLKFLTCIVLLGCTEVLGEGPDSRDEGSESGMLQTTDEGHESKTIDVGPESRMIGNAESKDYNEIELEPKRFGLPYLQVQLVELTSSTTTQDPVVVRENLCNNFGGKIINVTYCYQYLVDRDMTQPEASSFCETRGGRLWVPDIWDPNLSFILFKQFWRIYAANRVFLRGLWIGIEKDGGSIVSNTGQPFDDHPLLQPYLDYDYGNYDPENNGCFILVLEGNAFYLDHRNCEGSSEYGVVCEYTV